MSMTEELKELGVNVDEGLDRVMGDESLYDMMLGMFLDAIRDNPAAPGDFDGSDLEALTKRVHTMKGITGNLSMTPLYEGYNETLGLLRSGKPQEARAAFEAMLPTQEKIIACIQRYKQ